MDRFLVYGYLEEITHFTEQDALKVAQELGGEIAGDFLNRIQQAREESESLEAENVEPISDSDDAKKTTSADEAGPDEATHQYRRRKTDIDDSDIPAASQHSESELDDAVKVANGETNITSDYDHTASPIQKRLHGLERKLKKLSEKTKSNRR